MAAHAQQLGGVHEQELQESQGEVSERWGYLEFTFYFFYIYGLESDGEELRWSAMSIALSPHVPVTGLSKQIHKIRVSVCQLKITAFHKCR